MAETPAIKTQPLRLVAEGHRFDTPALQIVDQGGNPMFSVYGNGVTDFILITVQKAASHTLDISDAGKIVEIDVAVANNVTVPPHSSVPFPIGTQIMISQYGAGQTSIVAGAGVTIRSAEGALKIGAQYAAGTLVKRGPNEWYLFGAITV